MIQHEHIPNTKHRPYIAGDGRKPLLAVEGVSKRYASSRQDVTALEDVSFNVYEGEFVCMVGPSGGGKSTLLNMVAGVDVPDAGHTYFDGDHVRGPGPDRVLVFQDPALLPWLNVRQNVEFGLKLKGAPPARARDAADRWLELVGLKDYERLHPHELSGGMRQRAQLARALAVEPRMLLMDEPFASLDAQTRERLQDELQALFLRARTTVLFVTHNVQEAALLADRVIVLSASPGRVKCEVPVPMPRPRRSQDLHVGAVATWVRAELQHDEQTAPESAVGDTQ